MAGASFSFDSSGDNQITASFPYRSQFFIDALTGITFYVDTVDNRVEALLTLPETTRYAFFPADGNTYLIHYNAVQVVFPVIAGGNVNAGVATVGSDSFTILIDEVDPVAGGGAAVPVNLDSFEINGELYTITAGAVGTNYNACKVVGAGKPPFSFTGPNTFKLSDPGITYTLHLDAADLPHTISASFPVLPSRDLISVGDEIFMITYASATTGTLRGQGQAAIAITNSAFTMSNPFDTTTAKFTFADANIYNAASVVGQFTVNQIPMFNIGSTSFTLDTVNHRAGHRAHVLGLLQGPLRRQHFCVGFRYRSGRGARQGCGDDEHDWLAGRRRLGAGGDWLRRPAFVTRHRDGAGFPGLRGGRDPAGRGGDAGAS